MRKRNFRYYCRMVIKTIIILTPLIIIICSNCLINYTAIPQGATSTGINYCLQEIVYDSFDTLYNLPLNAWYKAFIEAIGFEDLTSTAVLIYPLYLIWVEIFDLLLHLIFFFTDLFHKFLGAEK